MIARTLAATALLAGTAVGLAWLGNRVLTFGWPLTIVVLIGATLWLLVALFLTSRAQSRSLTRSISLALNVVVFLVWGDLAARAVAHQLALHFNARNLAGYVLDRDSTTFGSGGDVIHYQRHHVMNYSLNPRALLYRERQFNADYLIRRGEPIRPREQVSWRGLALGGSTTFDDTIDYERDTWVRGVELRLRATHGEAIDFINGGVGGYTLLDNIQHYIALLSSLDPQVVLLFVGINDVHPRNYGNIRPDYSNYRRPWTGPDIDLGPAAPLPALFGSYRLYRVLRDIVPARTRHLWHFVTYPYPNEATWPAALAANGTEIFESHLRNFVALLRAQGRTVIIAPQVAILGPVDRFGVGGSNSPTYVGAVAQHNDVARRVADETGALFLSDVQGFTAEDMADAIHFNNRGAARMADIVTRFLADHALVQSQQARAP